MEKYIKVISFPISFPILIIIIRNLKSRVSEQERSISMKGIMRGHLKGMILNSLKDKSMSGSEIMLELEKDIGWKPSCGSIYPLLNSLEEEGISKVANNISGKKVYSLTRKGMLELKKHNEEKEEIVGEIVKVHKMIESTYGANMHLKKEDLDYMRSGKMMFSPLHKEIHDLGTEFMKVTSTGINAKKNRQIKKILKKATDDLKQLGRSDKEI